MTKGEDDEEGTEESVSGPGQADEEWRVEQERRREMFLRQWGPQPR